MGFVFAVCQPGFERILKDDVGRTWPGLRLAFSRPGIVTFKSDGEVEPEVARPSPWARAWGASLGRAAGAEALLDLAPAEARRLHVFARDPGAEGATLALAEARAAIDAAAPGRFAASERAEPGELVLDVVVAPGEPWLAGAHRHERERSAHAGGSFPVEVPADSPSRAYAKIEEAIAWAGLPVGRGEVAVEVGSAPGGAAYALARRGVTVWGVDPAEMSATVLAYRGPGGARVHHVKTTLGGVQREELPGDVDWLLVDVHLAPPVALRAVSRLLPLWRGRLHAVVFTLKMNDAAMQRGLPTWVERLRELGFPDVEVAHLPSNRSELCAVGRAAASPPRRRRGDP